MNEDKMVDVEDKIKSIDEQVKQLCEAHDTTIKQLRNLRSKYCDVYNGLKAGDEIMRLEKKDE